MATIPATHNWIAGDDATSGNLQTLSDGINFVMGTATSTGSKKPHAKLRQTVQTTVPTALGPIAMDTEDVDYDNGHSIVTNTSRYTAQCAGWHDPAGQLCVAGNAGATAREAAWAVNGTVVPGTQCGYIVNPFSTGFSITLPGVPIYLNAGDYLEMFGISGTAGVTTSVSGAFASSMSVEWRSN